MNIELNENEIITIKTCLGFCTGLLENPKLKFMLKNYLISANLLGLVTIENMEKLSEKLGKENEE